MNIIEAIIPAVIIGLLIAVFFEIRDAEKRTRAFIAQAVRDLLAIEKDFSELGRREAKLLGQIADQICKIREAEKQDSAEEKE